MLVGSIILDGDGLCLILCIQGEFNDLLLVFIVIVVFGQIIGIIYSYQEVNVQDQLISVLVSIFVFSDVDILLCFNVMLDKVGFICVYDIQFVVVQ